MILVVVVAVGGSQLCGRGRRVCGCRFHGCRGHRCGGFCFDRGQGGCDGGHRTGREIEHMKNYHSYCRAETFKR